MSVLFLKKNNHYLRVPLKEILFIQADGNYSTIYTASHKFIYSVVLKKVQDQLPSSIFLRTHRSYLVNINSVTGFEGNILFVGTHKIPVSKSLRDGIFKLFFKRCNIFCILKPVHDHTNIRQWVLSQESHLVFYFGFRISTYSDMV